MSRSYEEMYAGTKVSINKSEWYFHIFLDDYIYFWTIIIIKFRIHCSFSALSITRFYLHLILTLFWLLYLIIIQWRTNHQSQKTKHPTNKVAPPLSSKKINTPKTTSISSQPKPNLSKSSSYPSCKLWDKISKKKSKIRYTPRSPCTSPKQHSDASLIITLLLYIASTSANPCAWPACTRTICIKNIKLSLSTEPIRNCSNRSTPISMWSTKI